MKKQQREVKIYSPEEERINVISHAAGFFFSLAATVALVWHSALHGTVWHVVSFAIFGASLMLLYAASTCYHRASVPEVRRRLKVFDHASIYVLIAGSYTPFTLVTLHGTLGWVIFGLAWGAALTGVILKLFFTGRYNRLSTIMYVVMGWVIVFAIKPLLAHLSGEGVFWLIAGGVAYTVGALIYSLKKIRFNHAIFHLFVLLGSVCHFAAVMFYVLPLP